MSASGYTPIQLYRTSTAAAAPSAGNLAAGELAINLTDEKLYFKNAGGTVKVLASTGTVTVPEGGTGATTLTSGYLLKGNGTSPVTASVVYDTGTNVGIGTPAPSSLLNIYSATSATFTVDGDALSQINLRRSSTNAALPQFTFAKSRGTIAARTAVVSGDGLGSVRFQAFGGTTDRIIASITGAVDTFVSDTDISGYLTFATSASGSAAATERARLTAAGDLGVGLSAPTYRLDTSSASFTGIRSTNTDATSFNQFNLTAGTSIGLLRQYGQTHATNPNELSMVSISGPITFSPAATERFRIDTSGGITSANLADGVGYKGLPQNAQTSAYTLVLNDMGKHISITTGGVVIPANGATAFPTGTAISIYNNSGSNQTISITTDTLRQAGTANTGSRTLAQYGLATVVKVSSTVWVISGAGVS